MFSNEKRCRYGQPQLADMICQLRFPEILAIQTNAPAQFQEAIRDQFQVFVLPNLYGDIITDEAAQIQGGVGTAGSANIGDRYAMFEAIHGSAPRLIADGLSAYANPASILKATAMLLRHICRTEAAQRLENALDNCTVVMTGDTSGATGAEYANAIMNLL